MVLILSDSTVGIPLPSFTPMYLLSTLCWVGQSAVKMDMVEGTVQEPAAMLRWNSTLSLTSLSRFGVVDRL